MGHHDHRAPRAVPRPSVLDAMLPRLAQYEDPALIHRIGMFAVAEAMRAPSVEAFRAALRAQFPEASQTQFEDACAYAAALVTKTWNEPASAQPALAAGA